MASHGKRGDGVRLKVRMFPTEIVVDSAIKTITIEPFWMMVFFAECHSIHDVKDTILSKLNMRANKIKIIDNKLKNSGNWSLSMESDNEAEIFESNAESDDQQKPKSRTKTSTKTNHSSTVPIATLANKQSITITPHPVTVKPKTVTKLIRFESCRLSIDNCVLPSCERSEILKDDDLVSVKVTSCKLCELGSLELDRSQQKIFKSRKLLSKSDELVENGVHSDDFFFEKPAANCDSISLNTDESSEIKSKTKYKKRKRTVSHEIDQSLINIDEETSNEEKKGVSECENNIIMTSCLVDAIDKSPGKKRKRSNKRNRMKPSSEDDNSDLRNLGTDIINLDQESTSYQENGISNNIIDAIKGFMPEPQNGDTRIINNSKEKDEQNVSEMEMENSVETVASSRESNLPHSEIDASNYLEQLLKKRAEELSARNSKPTCDSLTENTTDQPKRKRNRKRKKKGTSASSAQPLETAVTQTDYSLHLPPHLMPQNSRLTFDREDEFTVPEVNRDVSFLDTPVTTTAPKNSESNEEVQVSKRILKPLHGKLAEQNTLSGDKSSQINGDDQEKKKEIPVLPHSSGDRSFQNSVRSMPVKPSLSDANLRRATVSFIDRALMTPMSDDAHQTSNTSTPLGTPIDPTDKFQQLLRQRSFSGRQLEVSKSVAGHSLCVSHRKKRDKSFDASFSSAADPETDVLTNVSTIQQATSLQPSPAQRQATELRQSTDTSRAIITQTSSNQSFKSADVNDEKLKGLPKAGDILVFKVLELSDDYTPTLSDFKEAKVLHVDSESFSVQVELKKEKGRQRRQGRFELNYGEDEDEDYGEFEQDNVVIYGLSELLEMSVISGADHGRPRK
ncbi:unnamed protein product [Lymnaea stagnalis]|uniref:Coilin tudor domain-containing protein n=1 Tax=Lymnaea stagnalis TaxID=6523 RepID=A0AAV2I4E1_LYMST